MKVRVCCRRWEGEGSPVGLLTSQCLSLDPPPTSHSLFHCYSCLRVSIPPTAAAPFFFSSFSCVHFIKIIFYCFLSVCSVVLQYPLLNKFQIFIIYVLLFIRFKASSYTISRFQGKHLFRYYLIAMEGSRSCNALWALR